MVQQLKSEFRVFYFDDGTVGGSLQDVLWDLDLVERMAPDLGLQLNHSRSELICDDQSVSEAMLLEVPGLHLLNRNVTDILGSPIENVEQISDIIQGKSQQFWLLGDRLCLLHLHDAIFLLRHSFSIPKILYILRMDPCFLSSQIVAYDGLLRSILGDITNVHLRDDTAWHQASLPIGAGGIGIRRAAQLAPSAFLASAAGCSDLVH